MSADMTSLDAIFVLNSLALGGSEKKVVALANCLRSEGVRTGVACLNGPEPLSDKLSGDIPRWNLRRRGKVSLPTVLALRRIVAATRPRTLLAVNLYPALYVAAAMAGAGQPRPLTVGLVNTATRECDSARRQFYRRVLQRLDRTAHGCEAQRSLWLQPDSAAWRRSSVIYNGVDHHEFRPGAGAAAHPGLRLRYGLPPDRFVMGSVGRLSTEKNQILLIEALARLRAAGIDAHLLLVGDGTLRRTLAQRATALALQRHITFTGEVADVRPLLGLMDVFVLPSVESFSNAALEAMAMARPVVLTHEGGGPEMLRDGIEGHLLPAADLARRLPKLLVDLHASREQRVLLGAAARARVISHFSIDAMVNRYRHLLGVHESRRAHD